MKGRRGNFWLFAFVFLVILLITPLWHLLGSKVTVFQSGNAPLNFYTGAGTITATVQAVETAREDFCNNTLVYFNGDYGTGGSHSNQNRGSFCIKDNSPELVSKLQDAAAKATRLKAEYVSAPFNLCGCDYNAWITSVQPA